MARRVVLLLPFFSLLACSLNGWLVLVYFAGWLAGLLGRSLGCSFFLLAGSAAGLLACLCARDEPPRQLDLGSPSK